MGCELEEYKWREDHKKAFPEGSGDLAIVQLTNASIAGLGEVNVNFLPSLSHGRVQSSLVVWFHPTTRESYVSFVCVVGYVCLPKRGITDD